MIDALKKALADEVEYRIRTAVALAKGGHAHEDQVVQGRNAVSVILARHNVDLESLRTEYALEVGFAHNTDGVILEISDDAATPKELRQRLPGTRVVARTVGVTPWLPINTEEASRG